MDPNDTQPGGQSGRTITIRLTRDTIMLIAALLFLGTAILLAVVFPSVSPNSSAPTASAATTPLSTAVAGRATADASTPGAAAATPAATSAPNATAQGDGAGAAYPPPTSSPATAAEPTIAEPTIAEPTSAAEPDTSASPTELPIFAPTRSVAAAETPGAQPTARATTPIATFGQPTAASGPANTTPTVPVFGENGGGTPTLEPTATSLPPTRPPAPSPTRRPTAVPAPTAVPMDVLRGTVRWTAAQSPIVLRRDQRLVAGATLLIEPGVEVRLAPGVSLFADGTVYALGQPDRPVRFVGLTPQRWEGIVGRPGANITLENTEIRGGGAGGTVLESSGGNLTMHHVRINDNGGHVQVRDSRLEMRDSEIAGNDMPYGSALEASYASGNGVILTNNRIGGNRLLVRGTAPVRISNTTSTEIINLDLRGNLLVGDGGPDLLLVHEGGYTGGLDPRAVAGPSPFLGTLTCNTLVGGTDGLSLRGEVAQAPLLPLAVNNNAIEKHTPPIIPVYLEYGIGRGATSEMALDMRNNWWGSPLGPYDPERHADGRGESVGDNIEFGPWLTERPACAPSQ